MGEGGGRYRPTGADLQLTIPFGTNGYRDYAKIFSADQLPQRLRHAGGHAVAPSS